MFCGDLLADAATSKASPTAQSKAEDADKESRAKAKAKKIAGLVVPLIGKCTAEALESIFSKYVDKSGLAKALCGSKSESPELNAAVIKYLRRILNSEAVKKAAGYALADAMRITVNESVAIVSGQLVKAGQDPVPIRLILDNEGLLARELEVVGVPLIGSIRGVMIRYCESNGIDIRKKNEQGRIELAVDAIEKHLSAK
jgi:hypothetical protein